MAAKGKGPAPAGLPSDLSAKPPAASSKHRHKKVTIGVPNTGSYKLAHYSQANGKPCVVGDALFCPDGSLLVTYDKASKEANATLTIRDANEVVRGEERQSLHTLDRDRRFSEYAPTCFDFSPNGELLATGERDGRVLIWSTETGVSVLTMEDHQHGHESNAAVVDVVFSPSGLLIASCDVQGKIVIWEPRFSKKVHPLVLRQLALFAMGTHDGTLPTVLQPIDADVKEIGLEKYLKRAQTYDLESDHASIVQARPDDPRLLELKAADSSLRTIREEIALEARGRLEALHKCFFQTKGMVRHVYRSRNGDFTQKLSWAGSRATPESSQLVGLSRNEVCRFVIEDSARPPSPPPTEDDKASDVGDDPPPPRRRTSLISRLSPKSPSLEVDESGPLTRSPSQTSRSSSMASRMTSRSPSGLNKKKMFPPPDVLSPVKVTSLALSDLEQGDVHRLVQNTEGTCALISTVRGAKYLLPYFAVNTDKASLCIPLVAPVDKIRMSPVCMVKFAEGASVVVIGCWDGSVYVWDYTNPIEPHLESMWERPATSTGYTPVPQEVQHSGKYQRGRWRDTSNPERVAIDGRSKSLDNVGDECGIALSRRLSSLPGPDEMEEISRVSTLTSSATKGQAGSARDAQRDSSAGSEQVRGHGIERRSTLLVPSSGGKRGKGFDLDCLFDTCNTLAWMCSAP
eukprot:m.463433 g.463433  ORF g.463433 m.463433 type:complete len:686 (+) comp23036_c0_seq1:261-2318(+)